jgi:nitroreductase
MNMHERPAMTIDEAIRRRRSVRGFLPDEIPGAMLHEVFELAQWSPSNCNVQPWTPHVVSGEALQRLRASLVAAGMRDSRSSRLAGRRQIHRCLSRAPGGRGAEPMARWGRAGDGSAERWPIRISPSSKRRMLS